MKLRHLITCLSGFILSGVANAQPTDPFLGTFTSAETGIKLVMAHPNSRYEGVFSVQGATYPCTATRRGNALAGHYADAGRSIEFTISTGSGGYVLTTEGINIPMQRTASPPPAGAAPRAAPPSGAPVAARASGQSFSDPDGGYRFTSPTGWTLQSQQGGWVFKRTGRETVLTVSPHQYASVEAVLVDVADQRDAASNTALTASKERYGANGVLVTFSGTLKGQPMVLTILTLVSPHGGGVTLTTIAPRAEHTGELPQTLKSIAATVTFSKPQMSAVARQWQQWLSGRQLLYFYTVSGFSERQSYDLCPGGTFVYNADASASSSNINDSFSAATRGGNSGSWHVTVEGNQAVLVLNYRDGRVARLTAANNNGGNGILLNGKRYLTQASPVCR
ncbi:MAG: hypothetical protein H7Z72_01815 [Bacteroidetes bacterium]|nr:hypothetical protein [Fibrella sp.]